MVFFDSHGQWVDSIHYEVISTGGQSLGSYATLPEAINNHEAISTSLAIYEVRHTVVNTLVPNFKMLG